MSSEEPQQPHRPHRPQQPQQGWQPLPGGDYDAEATAFVQLPDGLLDRAAAPPGVDPLAAPGQGYVPPPIGSAASAAPTEPGATGEWTMPFAEAGGHPAAAGGAQWHAPADGGWPDPGAQGATGQWSVPPAADDSPDESGEYLLGERGRTGAQYPGGSPAAGRSDQWQDGTGGQWHGAQDAAGRSGAWGYPTEGQLPDAAAESAARHGGEDGAQGDWRAAGAATGHWPAPDGPSASDESGAYRMGDSPVGGGSWPGPADASRGGSGAGPARPGADEMSSAGRDRTHDSAAAGRFATGGDPWADTGTNGEMPDEGGEFGPSRSARDRGPAGIDDARLRTDAGRPDGPTNGNGQWQADAASAELHGARQEFTPGGEYSAPDAGARTAEDHGRWQAQDDSASRVGRAAEDAIHRLTGGGATIGRSYVPADDPAADAESAPTEGATGAADAAPDTAARGETTDGQGERADERESGAEPSDSREADTQESGAADPHSEHPHASYVLTVNGADRPVTDAWIGESLLYVLRERLGLAGAKDGCSQGECGACSVQVDGRLVASCLVPAATAAGSEVRTVEGLAVDGAPSDVQRALAASGAVQCGFCVPGLAMTVHDLLEGNHAPTELETRQAICGNLCRCSGYRGVLDAVADVVEERAESGEASAAAESGRTDAQPDPATESARIPHQAGPYGGDSTTGGPA
ncbi:2Fe-2S iron-sulfur cluster-binding protein [Streptomyces sp. NPDC004647]|uniref:2Fe-2S iron-sulfur cluster-binding protein n=1 Tax=Streptomyces sp. NPDC004647 TaxID=3154671 RepID=UPI0033BE3583